MTPLDFSGYVAGIAGKLGFDPDELILGGDHLGPLVWSKEPEESAMEKAETLIAAFAEAGFGKIHIDCSMRLGDDDPAAPLPAETVAARAAKLAAVAERHAVGKPVYVIGSEVPIPGGATEEEGALAVTSREALRHEYTVFRDAFLERGLAAAWDRVIAVVVQPGVEFGDDQVFLYNRTNAEDLIQAARELPNIVLEGHSTDYQPTKCLREMREDGIAVLKVGPALTFALRSALFALEGIERVQYRQEPSGGYSNFAEILEREMLASPDNWIRHYHGDEETLAKMRKYSLSDRCRYYLDRPNVAASIARLICNVDAAPPSFGLLDQFLPRQVADVISGNIDRKATTLIKEQVKYVLRTYGDHSSC
jgi:D-tagatose-1,6-bisphosphate aldolase subunit GatZ/KbaZ